MKCKMMQSDYIQLQKEQEMCFKFFCKSQRFIKVLRVFVFIVIKCNR